MADDKKQTASEEDQGAGVVEKSSKKRTCARHCKRYWWIHLIVAIVIIVLVVVLVIFVGVPKIAQSKMNQAKLEIQGVNVLNTKSDDYLMQINATITTDGSIHAKIDPFVGDMYLEDYPGHAPFARLHFPATTADKHQTVNVTEEIHIEDMEAFRRFNIWFHSNETLRITIKGDTKVKPRGLAKKYGVTFEKTVEIKGLNVFKGTQVTDGQISLTADKNGKNFNGTANIPNASDFTLDIGNITFKNFIGDTEVGKLYIDNFLLRPGDNVVGITAFMNQSKVINLLGQKPYCEGGSVPLKLLGEDVENHDQNISYFAAALASVNQTVELDISKMIKGSLGITLPCQ